MIDKKTPEFDETLSKGKVERGKVIIGWCSLIHCPICVHLRARLMSVSVRQIFKALNKAQKAAVLRALLSRDYVLIKGYPGTGLCPGLCFPTTSSAASRDYVYAAEVSRVHS